MGQLSRRLRRDQADSGGQFAAVDVYGGLDEIRERVHPGSITSLITVPALTLPASPQ